jgi:hypothetical protein
MGCTAHRRRRCNVSCTSTGQSKAIPRIVFGATQRCCSPAPRYVTGSIFSFTGREFQQSFLNATIIQGPTPGTLNGNPAEQLLVTIPYPDGRFKLTEIWTVVGGRAYQIEISLKEGLYTQVSPPHIQKMLESLQLRPVGAVVTWV